MERSAQIEERYLSKNNYVLAAPVQITEPRSATALRNVHTAEGDTTHQSAITSLFGYKKPEHMLVATGKSSVTYKSQPCHARGGNTRATTNYCAKYKPKLRQALYGCEDGGDQTAKQTVEQNSGHNKSGLSRPNRQSNLERNPQEDSQDIRPFGISFTRHLS